VTSSLEILEIIELHEEVVSLGVSCADESWLLRWASEGSLGLLLHAKDVVVTEVCRERI